EASLCGPNAVRTAVRTRAEGGPAQFVRTAYGRCSYESRDEACRCGPNAVRTAVRTRAEGGSARLVATAYGRRSNARRGWVDSIRSYSVRTVFERAPRVGSVNSFVQRTDGVRTRAEGGSAQFVRTAYGRCSYESREEASRCGPNAVRTAVRTRAEGGPAQFVRTAY